jgi:hypothetical protein
MARLMPVKAVERREATIATSRRRRPPVVPVKLNQTAYGYTDIELAAAHLHGMLEAPRR